MGNIWYFDFEAKLIIWLQSLGNGTWVQKVLIALNNAFSFFGEEIAAIAFIGFLYWGVNKKKGLQIGAMVIMMQNAVVMVKEVVCRLRPWQSVSEISLLREVDGYSFPSGHSTVAASLYPAMSRYYKDNKFLKVFAIALSILIPISRMYLGAHWFTDVITGVAVGYAGMLLFEWLFKVVKNENYIYIGIIVVMSFGWFYCNTTDFFTFYGLVIGLFIGKIIEEKFVHFEESKTMFSAILRAIGGGAAYVVLNSAIKALFGANFIDGTLGGNLFRTIRYIVIGVILMGVYPMAFKLFKKKTKTDK